MVTINVTDGACEIYPWMTELGKKLVCRKKVYKAPFVYKKEIEAAIQVGKNPKSVLQYNTEIRELFTVDANNHGFVLPGLLNRVLKELGKLNIKYTINKNLNPAIRPDPDWKRVGTLRGRQLEILASIAVSNGGIVKASTGVGKSFIIRQLCKMYPTLNVLVVSKAQAVVRELYNAISADLPDETGCIYAGINNAVGKRVVVTTTKSIHKVPEEEVQMLIVDECHCVGDNSIASQLVRFTNCRRFGMTATPFRSDGTEVMMEMFFGQLITDIGYEEAVESGNVTQLAYHMVPINIGPTFIEDDISSGKVVKFIDKKRWAYWRNYARNDTIVDITKEALNRGLQVLIMVETLEHAVHLHDKLHDVPVVHYGKTSDKEFETLATALCRSDKFKAKLDSWALDNNEDTKDRVGAMAKMLAKKYSLSKKQKDQLQDDMASGKLRCAIATTTWSTGVNFNQLNLLIRADAVSSKTANDQIPGRLSRLWPGKERGLLVDFADNWTPWAMNNSRIREHCYMSNRWEKKESLEELLNAAGDSSSSTP